MAALILVGEFDAGSRVVRILLDPDLCGGSFDLNPPIAEVIVGLGSKKWPRVLSILMHELLELAYVDLCCRYAPTPDYAADSAAYLFSMNHTQFGEATARVAWCMAKCVPEVSRAFEKWMKPAPAPKKRRKPK